MRDDVRDAAWSFVNGMIAGFEAEKWDNAIAFVTLTTDDETHQIHIDGIFPDAVAALAWAEQHQTELNQGMPSDEDPYVVTVYPVQEAHR